MITSTSNMRVKRIVQWQTKARERREAGIFLVEGIKMFLEAPVDWIREVYVSEELEGRLKASPGQRRDPCQSSSGERKVLQEREPESKVSSQNLSGKGKVLQEREPESKVSSQDLSGEGKVLQEREPESKVSSQNLSGEGKILQEREPESKVSSQDLSGEGKILQESRSDCQEPHWNPAEKETALQEKLQETGYETVSEEVFRKMSDTLAPQGILAVLKQPEYSLQTLLKTPDPFFIVLENLQDPGNLGTILRTGEGAGVTGVILSSDTADIFNPKTIRATMGSIYRVPFCRTEDLKETLRRLREAGVVTYAAHLRGKDYYDGFSFKGPVAFLIGNEGNGLKEETAALAERYVKIPMEGKVESLNAAVAAALLMYEVHRQRAAE